MPNIDDMIHNVTKLDGTYITVHHERCVLVRNRNADCLKCSTVCTTGCITFDGESLKIDTTRCIGCGTCATICPTCCLEAHNPNDAELLAQCETVADAHAGHVCIACGNIREKCENQGDASNNANDERQNINMDNEAPAQNCTAKSNENAARIECLGRIEETLLVELAEKGYEVTLVHGDCANCEHIKGRQMLERVMETRKQLLEAWNVDAKYTVTDRLPWEVVGSLGEDDTTQSKVTQPKEASQQANVEATNAEKPEPHYNKVMEDGTLPHFLPDRRERLLDSLASFGEPDDVVLNNRLWGHVIIDTDTCKSCRMCSVFCPTGALSRFDNEDGTFGVKHYAGDCIKCRECTTICPANALTLSDEVRARDVLSGLTDTYTMKPIEVERSGPHTIRDMARTFTGGTQVYER
jgi:Fe-S-cluster-containing hydrogenase component 2